MQSENTGGAQEQGHLAENERDVKADMDLQLGAHEDDDDDDELFQEVEDDDPMPAFDLGYETDPVERFLVMTRFQHHVQGLQRRLRARGRRVSPKRISDRDKDGERKKRGLGLVRQLRQRQNQVVQNIKQKVPVIQRKYEQRVEKAVVRAENMLNRVRDAKSRQLRHILCFVISMFDVVITAFWIGAWPHTFYMYFSLKAVMLITIRAVWYRWIDQHLFLLDLCYFANGALLLHIWLFPRWKWLAQAAQGCGGMLSVCVPLFRNSFVPHSADRMTSLHSHLMPLLMIFVLRWHRTESQKQAYGSFEDMSIIPGLTFYVMWAIFYHTVVFAVVPKIYKGKKLLTLFVHMCYGMRLYTTLHPAIRSVTLYKCVFVMGHFCVFLSGVPYFYCPYWIQCLCILFSTIWAFKNGAEFYITYFWKVYENQISAFEREMAAAHAEGAGKGNKTTPSRQGSAEDLSEADAEA